MMTATPPVIIGVIDIGANSIRAAIAQAYDDGKIEILEQLTRGIWFGKDTFQRGGLSAQSMRAGIEILKRFRKRFDEYGVTHIRTVATASIREAANADIFIDRVRIATGLEIEIIDPSVEIQYSVSAVQEELGEDFQKSEKRNVLIVNVGGGSTLLASLRDRTVVNSQSVNIGAIRLRESYSNSVDSPLNMAEVYRHNIEEVLSSVETYFPFSGNDYFVVMGGDVRFAAEQVGTTSSFRGLKKIQRSEFETFVRRCTTRTTQQLCRDFGLTFQNAETLVPSLLAYEEIALRAGVSVLHVTNATMRHGLLLNLAREVWGLEDAYFQKDVLDAAKSLAVKFHVDMTHANQTADLATRIFDELIHEHDLGQRYRFLLQLAAILQTSGQFISNHSYHKHSFYLISNSEIYGLSRSDTELIAFISRYSFRSSPKLSHTAYMNLSRKNRVIISKLAAILRVADALNHGQYPNPEEIRFQREGDELTLILPLDETLLLKTRALDTQGKMFAEVFGMRVLFGS